MFAGSGSKGCFNQFLGAAVILPGEHDARRVPLLSSFQDQGDAETRGQHLTACKTKGDSKEWLQRIIVTNSMHKTDQFSFVKPTIGTVREEIDLL